MPVLGIQPVGDESHKPGHWLPLLSAKPAGLEGGNIQIDVAQKY